MINIKLKAIKGTILKIEKTRTHKNFILKIGRRYHYAISTNLDDEVNIFLDRSLGDDKAKIGQDLIFILDENSCNVTAIMNKNKEFQFIKDKVNGVNHKNYYLDLIKKLYGLTEEDYHKLSIEAYKEREELEEKYKRKLEKRR